VLENVYKMLEHKAACYAIGPWGGRPNGSMPCASDVTELTERTDNAIKFLSDMFYARAYRMAAARVGVTDYRNLVERKLRSQAIL
jgi:hypothetical protein